MRRIAIAILMAALVIPCGQATELNDTGIAFCGDATTNSANCATVAADSGTYPRQDARYGRDAAAAAGRLTKIGGGEAGFDFTALDASGRAITPTTGATPHPCVRDNVSGLVWEVKTADGGLRDKNWTYTWYDSVHNYRGDPGTASGGNCKTSGRCDTEKYVADVNAAKLCGYSDWRMPTMKELEGIAHLGRTDPAVDPAYFPNTPSLSFWSGSPHPASDQSYAWFVNFYYGYAYVSYRSDYFSVRLVRGGQALVSGTGSCTDPTIPPSNPDGAYSSDNVNGTVTDSRTGLMWKKCSDGQSWTGSACNGTATTHDWASALTVWVFDRTAGFRDWRLPNVKELLSLVEECRDRPTINDRLFPNTPSSGFWSDSPYADNSNYAWAVGFSFGDADGGYRSYGHSVRLVRGGQSWSSFDSLSTGNYSLTLTNTGTGTGIVSSSPSGINCGGVCSASFASGTSVTLTATAASASTFSGWSGACSGTGTCTLTMASAQSVTATFSTASLPGSPSNVTVTAGDTQATVGFSLPANDGGSPITGYTVTASPGGITASGTASPITVTGLTNGTSYTLTVTASNAAGASAASAASLPVVPLPPTATQAFTPGWNLVGNGIDDAISVVATFNDAAKVTSVWKWLTKGTVAGIAYPTWALYIPAQSDGGEAFAKNRGYEFLTTIYPGEGYWLYAKQTFSVPLSTAALLSTVTLQRMPAGWNLVAVGDNPTPSAFNKLLAGAAAAGTETPRNLTSLWAWDTERKGWYFYAPNLEANGGLATYNRQKGYLDFGNKTLSHTTGFWVNRPTAESAIVITGEVSKTLNNSGGTITATVPGSTDKNITLQVPPSVLSANTTLTMATATNCPPSPDGLTSTACLKMGPSGTTFPQPVKIILPYTGNASGDVNEFVPMYYNDATSQWEETGVVESVDTTNKTVTITTTHFSLFDFFFAPTPINSFFGNYFSTSLLTDSSDGGLEAQVSLKYPIASVPLRSVVRYPNAEDFLLLSHKTAPSSIPIFVYRLALHKETWTGSDELGSVSFKIYPHTYYSNEMWRVAIEDGDGKVILGKERVSGANIIPWFQNKYFLWKFKCSGLPCVPEKNGTYFVKVTLVLADNQSCANSLMKGLACDIGSGVISKAFIQKPDTKFSFNSIASAKAEVDKNQNLCIDAYESKVSQCPVVSVVSQCTYAYSNWSTCSNGSQTRTVTSSTPTGCTGTPSLTQTCTAPACIYNYSNWSTCSNGSQTRTVTSATPTGCTGAPSLSQTCTAPACTYGYSNWSTCSNGAQTRTVTSSIPTGCTGTPSLSQTCTAPACIYGYSSWGTCSNGSQTRTVTSSTPDGCTGTPGLSQTCTSYTWQEEGWGSCTGSCGTTGTQTQTVYCKRSDNTQVADSYCTTTKPATSRACQMSACTGDAGFDFTALNASGQATAPTSGVTPHPCVRHNVTGLVWEVKTADGGLRDQYWTYTWYDSVHNYGGNPGATSGGDCKTSGRCDTEKYVADVNATRLCGYSDWRMPSLQELQSIVNHDRYNPTIDPTYFPNTRSSFFWSGSPDAVSSDYAWSVSFGYGSDGYDIRSYRNFVRLVRGGQ